MSFTPGENTPTYKASTLAVDDTNFLKSPDMRPLRFALEYAKADIGIRTQNIESTICCFGSARIPSPEKVEEIEARWISLTEKERSQFEKLKKLTPYYQEARRFGNIISRLGGALNTSGPIKNVIATGGGPGIMEAANRGAHEAGAPTIGFNIVLPHEQAPNPYISEDLCFNFHYFHLRKFHLVMHASAIAIFPGGVGTLDELFEIITLQQTKKGHVFPIILFGREFWKHVFDLNYLASHGLISEEDIDLIKIVDTTEEAIKILNENKIF